MVEFPTNTWNDVSRMCGVVWNYAKKNRLKLYNMANQHYNTTMNVNTILSCYDIYSMQSDQVMEYIPDTVEPLVQEIMTNIEPYLF